MTEPTRRKFLVAGAGLGGALMASYLGRMGHAVEVYERRSDPRGSEFGGGRSINLAISTRGLHALDGVGLADRILQVAVPMRGRLMHSEDGALTFQPYGTRHDQVINSVSRSGLNLELIEAADELENVTFRFGHRIEEVDLDTPVLVVEDADGHVTTAAGDVVVGADGAFSSVRRRMQLLDRFDFSQSYLEHGYKELTIPAGPDGKHVIEKNALHIWPRGAYMMIALPNLDGSFTCTLFWPFSGQTSVEALQTEGEVARFFESTFADAVPLMPTLIPDFFEHPTSSLVTVRSWPWRHRDRVVLLGDACHAVVPFYGQGANAAFEDCVVLYECLERHGSDLEWAFSEYERLRKDNVDALADMAIANFVEMRDHVASRSFLFKKRFEKLLHRLVPSRFVPLYSLVTFSRVPYAEARRQAERQNRVVRGLLWTMAIAGGAVLAAALWSGLR